MSSHPSTASIPIILAGLGMLDSMSEAGKSPDTAGLATSSSMHSIAGIHNGQDKGSVGKRRASVGLGILQAPLEIVEGMLAGLLSCILIS